MGVAPLFSSCLQSSLHLLKAVSDGDGGCDGGSALGRGLELQVE